MRMVERFWRRGVSRAATSVMVFGGRGDGRGGLPGWLGLCWYGSPFDPRQPAHVVGEVGQRDPGGCPDEADGPDDQAEAPFLGGEDVLDPGPHLCPGGFGAADARGHRLAAGLGALELREQAAAVEQRQVGLRGGRRCPPRRRSPGCRGRAAAWVTADLRMKPCARSMPTWFL